MPKDLGAITGAIGAIYSELDTEDRPILVAFVERSVGSHYRRCASDIGTPRLRDQLLEAAAREDENAETLEGHDPSSAERLARLHSSYPQLEKLVASGLSEYSMPDQFELLAEAERAGRNLYRAFAQETEDATYQKALLECDQRECENASALDLVAAEFRRSSNE